MISEVDERLLEPPQPPTDIRCDHLEDAGKWILEEFSDELDAWLTMDDGHVVPLEAME